MKKNIDLGLLLIRVIIGFTMLLYGIKKAFNGLDFILAVLEKQGLPSFISYGVYVGEVIAPILMIIGFRTRLASLVFALTCFIIILLTKMDKLFLLNDKGGMVIELIAIYFVVSLGLFFTGAGKYAVSKKNNRD